MFSLCASIIFSTKDSLKDIWCRKTLGTRKYLWNSAESTSGVNIRYLTDIGEKRRICKEKDTRKRTDIVDFVNIFLIMNICTLSVSLN